MVNASLKITFQLAIFLTALFFLSFLFGFFSIEDILSITNINPESNAGKAVDNLFSELKIVTNNLFGLIFKII
jgi:hypothetical protein|tara:strand:- start:17351 stop:17569 length:219 start_codon:yes stop_codon:yes gene_type:complete